MDPTVTIGICVNHKRLKSTLVAPYPCVIHADAFCHHRHPPSLLFSWTVRDKMGCPLLRLRLLSSKETLVGREGEDPDACIQTSFLSLMKNFDSQPTCSRGGRPLSAFWLGDL